MLAFKNILREFACCSLLCGDGIYTPGVSAASHLRALYIAINYTLVVEWLSTGNLISHYPLSNIQHTAVNICISRKSSRLPLAGYGNVREDARGRFTPAPSRKAFSSYHHSLHRQAYDPSLISPQLWTREMCHQPTARCSPEPAPCAMWCHLIPQRGNGWEPPEITHKRCEHQISTEDSFMV